MPEDRSVGGIGPWGHVRCTHPIDMRVFWVSHHCHCESVVDGHLWVPHPCLLCLWCSLWPWQIPFPGMYLSCWEISLCCCLCILQGLVSPRVPLVTQDMQAEVMKRYYLTPIRTATANGSSRAKPERNRDCEDSVQRWGLTALGESRVTVLQKIKTLESRFERDGVCSKRTKSWSWGDICRHMFITALLAMGMT